MSASSHRGRHENQEGIPADAQPRSPGARPGAGRGRYRCPAQPHPLPWPVRRRLRRLAFPILIRRPPPAVRQARQPGGSRSAGDRLLGFLAAAAGIWAAVALVLAILLALVVTLAVIGVFGLAVASAAGRPLHAGAGEPGGAGGRPAAGRQYDDGAPADAAL